MYSLENLRHPYLDQRQIYKEKEGSFWNRVTYWTLARGKGFFPRDPGLQWGSHPDFEQEEESRVSVAIISRSQDDVGRS